jgi:xanthine dehydrogenase small subunit
VGRSPKDKPIVCVAVYIAVDEGLPVDVRLAVGGAEETPARLYKTEHLLKGQLLSEEKVIGALAPSLAELAAIGDFRGSAEYRMEMAKVLLRRATMGAWDRARRG